MAESLPPLKKADIQASLANDTFAVYIYAGAKTDYAWDVALEAEGLLTRLRVYLATDRATVAEWLPTDDTVGVVFGWGKTPHAHLGQDEAEDTLLVLRTIRDARGGS